MLRHTLVYFFCFSIYIICFIVDIITVEGNILQSSDKSPDKSACAATVILKWIVDSAKAKVMEIIEKISKLVNELFQTVESEKDAGEFESFDEKLRSSFMLSVMVLLVVVVTRSYGA